MITIEPYDPQWPSEFTRLAAPLYQALGALALRIDHIGSTAVASLAAKDVIDMQITVRDLSASVQAALVTLGYERDPDIRVDHRPPNASGPDSDWQKWFFHPPATQRRTNLHVRVDGRPNQRYPLLFRDYLRTHPVARDAYAIIKRQLARYHPEDMDAYYDIKNPVCDIVWGAAEEWAHETGWQPSD